jgi:hypothetical protein
MIFQSNIQKEVAIFEFSRSAAEDSCVLGTLLYHFVSGFLSNSFSCNGWTLPGDLNSQKLLYK